MSANLDLVRSIMADWERGDFSLGEWTHRDYEHRWADGPEPDSWKRGAEMREALRDMLRTWERFQVEVDDCRELDDRRVLVLWRYTARGRVSGLDAERMPEQGANVFELGDGRVRRLSTYVEAKHALSDLGLEEQAVPEESTTPDLIGLARLANEAVNRRDWDAVMSFYAPDAVDVGVEALGTFEGAAAIRGYYEDAASTLDDFHVETEEITDLGNGVTFAVVLITGHPVDSSGEVQIRYGSVASWTEGVVERLTAFMDIDEGRAAAERLAQERE